MTSIRTMPPVLGVAFLSTASGPDLGRTNRPGRKFFLPLLGLVSFLYVASASAKLIDIVVIGTWDNTNTPVINPQLLNPGDKFVVRATYDNATFFNGSDGVTSDVNPGINPGTSLEFILPHNGPVAPNPVTFNHNDHVNIGFAPNAQIEFDGPNAGNPGNFRNFEWHFEQNYNGNALQYDQFFDLQIESVIFNGSQGFNEAASSGAGHLSVVTNDITANAGGPYVFDAGNLSVNTNGTSGGGSGFSKVFDWTGPGGTLTNSPGASIALGLAESGLTNAGDTDVISLVVTENFTEFQSASDNASVSYANTAPMVLAALGVNEVDDSITFGATIDDVDLIANALVSGFEDLTLEFLFMNAVFLTGNGNLDLLTLHTIFGGSGVFEAFARATDLGGATDTLAFDITVAPVPIPAAVWLFGSALGLLGWMRRKVA